MLVVDWGPIVDVGDLAGTHVWTGDIFGSGETTTVSFTVVQVGSGDGAYLEITAVEVASPFVFAVEGPKTEADHEDGDDSDDVHAKLKIELRGKDRQELLGDEAIGTHIWDGLRCDGTNASVTYTVAADGSLKLDGVSVADGVTCTVVDDDDDDVHDDD